MYRPIDTIRTGEKIKKMLAAAGYEVRDIQKYQKASAIHEMPTGSCLKRLDYLANDKVYILIYPLIISRWF